MQTALYERPGENPPDSPLIVPGLAAAILDIRPFELRRLCVPDPATDFSVPIRRFRVQGRIVVFSLADVLAYRDAMLAGGQTR